MIQRRLVILRILIVVSFWLLLVVTNRIWVGRPESPMIPFFGFFVPLPVGVDDIVMVVLLISSVASLMLTNRQSGHWANLVSIALITFLVLGNQHRLQPWCYLTLIQLAMFIGQGDRWTVRFLRLIIASVYVYSAISKLDYSFFHHLGLRFVDTLLDLIGLNPHLMAPTSKQWLIWILPLGELSIGMGLMFQAIRKFAVAAAVLLHGVLVLILGPWGLGHHAGVLLWNICFAMQVVFLFSAFRSEAEEDEHPLLSARDLTHVVRLAVVGFVLIFPCFELVGIGDHWPAWSLYSDRTDKVEVFVGDKKFAALPESFRRHVGPPQPFTSWRKLYLEQWCLEQLRAPIYPEDRFQVGVVLALGKRYELDDDLRIIVHGPPDRWTGERKAREFSGIAAIKQLAAQFWLNTDARWTD